jgi:hypothetical protein
MVLSVEPSHLNLVTVRAILTCLPDDLTCIAYHPGTLDNVAMLVPIPQWIMEPGRADQKDKQPNFQDQTTSEIPVSLWL